ncbi:hypothetical protein STIAU_0900, partial [Stigmatella aurantiaca DW4/3-1]
MAGKLGIAHMVYSRLDAG